MEDKHKNDKQEWFIPPCKLPLPYHVYGKTFGVEQTFLKDLKTQLGIEKIELQAEHVKSPPMNKELPLLMFCVNATRIGTDAEAALQLFPDHQTILVVMNHRPPQVFKSDPHSATHVSRGNILDVIDCFFFQSNGLYSCEQNKKATRDVANIISDFLAKTYQFVIDEN